MNTPPEHEDDDDGLEWLRQIRRDIQAEFGNDMAAYTRYLREQGEKHPGKLIPAPEPPPDFEERVARVMAMAPEALEHESAVVAEDPPTRS
jgi:hypothetical protein